MYNNNSYDRAPAELNSTASVSEQSAFINRVYGWMTAGLAITGAAAWATYNIPALHNMILGSRGTYMLLIIAELVIVFGMSAAINKISASAATACFVVFSLLNGLTLSSIFLVYEFSSITATFFVTSGTFGAMSLYGYMTKRDLTTVGNLAFMGLIGIIIASIVNIFWYSAMVDRIICYLGVLIFVALTAWDTQNIKRLSYAVADGEVDRETGKKFAIIGALKLYLDFINLFLFLLRLLGNRK